MDMNRISPRQIATRLGLHTLHFTLYTSHFALGAGQFVFLSDLQGFVFRVRRQFDRACARPQYEPPARPSFRVHNAGRKTARHCADVTGLGCRMVCALRRTSPDFRSIDLSNQTDHVHRRRRFWRCHRYIRPSDRRPAGACIWPERGRREPTVGERHHRSTSRNAIGAALVDLGLRVESQLGELTAEGEAIVELPSGETRRFPAEHIGSNS